MTVSFSIPELDQLWGNYIKDVQFCMGIAGVVKEWADLIGSYIYIYSYPIAKSINFEKLWMHDFFFYHEC